MKHYLNVCDIDGSKVEPVDIVTFGSPCQDLSVAGKRAGLKHEVNGDDETTRSGLFMEAVRIIKEMRAADEKRNRESGRTDEPVRPRFALWENVPGAFSSNKGQDFRVVLEELARIADETVSIPMPQKGKWTNAGEIHGDGFSIAWRTLDAQYAGVPQRRRRIFLVADFGGECAGEVLFECQSLRGNPPQSREERQTAPGDATNRIAPDDREGAVPYTLKIRSGVEVDSNGRAAGKGALIQKDKSATLGVSQDQYLFQPVVALEPGIAAREGGHIYEDVAGTLRAKPGDNMQAVAYGISSYDSNAMKSSNPHSGVYEADTSRTLDLNGGNPACNQGGIAVVEPVAFDTYNMQPTGDKTVTLRAGSEYNYAPVFVPADAETVDFGRTADRIYINPKTSVTLSAQGGGMGAKTGLYCVPEAVAYNGENITSPLNKTDPKPGDPCHTLGTDSRNYLVAPVAVLASSAENAEMTDGSISPCLMARAGTGGNQLPLVTVAIEGNGSRPSHNGDCYKETDKSYTLNTTEVHGVAYCIGNGQVNQSITEEVAGALNCMHDQQAILQPVEDPIVIDRAFFNQGQNALYEPQCYTDGTVPTLVAKGPSAVAAVDCRNATESDVNGTMQAKANGGFSYNCNQVVRVRYIVRRLTPTECARLQGFPDKWGHYPEKDSLTDEEYRFWVKVQQTHAIINGKKPWKDDVKADTVLKWYNGLHTDSAEYKMWGNGIALPCARIPLRGIAQLGAKTLASLFDGSGGFPLAGRLEGIEPRWSSEVEPYPIAVTVHQFGGLG